MSEEVENVESQEETQTVPELSQEEKLEKMREAALAEYKSRNNQPFNQKAEDKLIASIAQLIIFKPIYGIPFMYLHKRQVSDIPTMGVGPLRRVDLALFYNADFVMKLSGAELRAVLQHEALHVLLHHITRANHYGYQHQLYNVAADLAINCHLTELPNGVLYPKQFELPDHEASEWYYEKIKQKAQEQGQGQGQGQGKGICEGKGDLLDDHSSWQDCEEDIIREKIQGIAAQAVKAQEQKGWSEIGSGLAKAIIDANKPQINWQRVVKYFIDRLVMAGKKPTRSRINRKEQASKSQRDESTQDVMYRQGTKKDFTSKLLVAIDVSGSVSDQEVAAFLSEINGMINHVEVHVTMFDTELLLLPPKHISKKISTMEIMGRGGTDFNPAIRYVEEHKYDGLIMFTDGYCYWPEPPKNVRVLWALSPQGAQIEPPYGKKVVVEMKK